MVLRERGVDPREGDHVEGQVPGREPRVFPGVRHREDVAGEDVGPVAVATLVPPRRRGRLVRIPLYPFLHHVMVELLRPQKPRVGLARDPPALLVHVLGNPPVKEVRLLFPSGEHPLERGPEPLGGPGRLRGEPEPDDSLLARSKVERVLGSALGAPLRGVDPVLPAVDHHVVEGILHVGRGIGRMEERLDVGLVLREEDPPRRIAGIGFQEIAAEGRVVALDESGPRERHPRLHLAPLVRAAPRPGVSEPQGRQHLQGCRLGPAVDDPHLDQEVIGSLLRIVHEDIEVALGVKNARVQELEFRVLAGPVAVLGDKPLVGERRLRILVEGLHPRMRRRRVEVEVALLHILAMIALLVGEPEEALLQVGVLAIPEGERETKPALAVGDAQEPVLAPAVGTALGLLVGEILPAFLVGGVVLPHRPPLPFGKIRAPALPVLLAALVFGEPVGLGVGRRRHGRRKAIA